jgi:polyphosphate glucokinase
VFSGNLDTSWNGTNVREQLEQATGCPATVLNDADAAGLAEFQYGAGHEHEGVVLVLTLGTGIGSALFHDGKLVRGTELGQLILKDPDIPELKKGLKGEHYAAASIKARLGLKWREWAPRLQVYLDYVELLFSPDLIILGGGCSRKFEKWGGYLTTHAELVPAELKNQAGIIGAAFAASLPDAPKIIKKPSARTPEPTG